MKSITLPWLVLKAQSLRSGGCRQRRDSFSGAGWSGIVLLVGEELLPFLQGNRQPGFEELRLIVFNNAMQGTLLFSLPALDCPTEA